MSRIRTELISVISYYLSCGTSLIHLSLALGSPSFIHNIRWLQCQLSPSLYVENEAYRKDECDAAPTSGSSKRRNQVKKTLSALSNKVKLNIKHEKPLSKCKCCE